MKCEQCEKEHCSCDSWEYFARNVNAPEYVRIEGNHYFIGGGSAGGACNGMYGQRHLIEFFDGRRLETFDLWHNGEIPAKFRERLPDNARFVETE